MMTRRVALSVFAIVLAAATVTAQRPRNRAAGRLTASAKSERVRLWVQRRERHFLLHVPASIPHDRRTPLVLVFHGGSDTPENMESMSGFSALADRAGFIVAYPEGIDKSWADGRASTSAEKMWIDDVAFARAIVADLAWKRAIDPARVYAAGPSNGGIFANRLGCEASDQFAAIGPVIGTIASRLVPYCRPSSPVSVAGIQGVADPVVPFDGGEVGEELKPARGGRVEGARVTQELWRQLDGCSPNPTVTALPVRVQDGTSVSKRAYAGCRSGTDVVWYEIAGGGHRWPPTEKDGLIERVLRRKLGVSSQNIDATETLWAFFEAHPKH